MNGYSECKYCNKKFVREANFKKHECRTMKRLKLLRSASGITAFEYYKIWMSIMGFVVKDELQFVESKFFTSFYNFSEFARKVALPAVDSFIKLMIEIDIQPKDWTQHIVYEHYIKNFDEIHNPEQQAEISKSTALELARIFECEVSDIFLHMEPGALIRIVQAKKLSPWFLMFSSKFKWFVQNEMTREQKILLEKYINPIKWRTKIEREPELGERLTNYVRDLGL